MVFRYKTNTTIFAIYFKKSFSLSVFVSLFLGEFDVSSDAIINDFLARQGNCSFERYCDVVQLVTAQDTNCLWSSVGFSSFTFDWLALDKWFTCGYHGYAFFVLKPKG